MVHRNDVDRVPVICVNCGAGYIAHQWPDGELQIMGTDTCDCGATDFEVIDTHDDDDVNAGTSSARGGRYPCRTETDDQDGKGPQ